MAFAVPVVFVTDAETRDEALQEAIKLGLFVGEPVQFDFDFEDLDAPEPSFKIALEVDKP